MKMYLVTDGIEDHFEKEYVARAYKNKNSAEKFIQQTESDRCRKKFQEQRGISLGDYQDVDRTPEIENWREKYEPDILMVYYIKELDYYDE